MKIFLLSALLVFAISALSQPGKKSKKFLIIKTILTDVNNDNATDTIILSSSLKEKDSFDKISIALAGHTKRIFYAKDSWTIVDKWFLDSNKNSINTRLLFLKKTDKHAVILLFGVSYGAGGRGEFSIINIEDNSIKMVFDHYEDAVDVEIPVILADLEHTNRLCFVYTNLFELEKPLEKLNADIGSYHPYFVYPVDNDCHVSKALSKKYMEDHYVFAGYNYNKSTRILYPRDKKQKPRIWKK